tara:strand:- start:7441 stop:8103 length:663 start_codon:yes stop_codon:yes gene_type:complete
MKKHTLLLLIGIAVAFTIVSTYFENKTMHYFAKPLSTILVLLIPILFAKNPLKPYKELILIGLVLCLIGDVFLMFEAYFIHGLISFLIGHLFFMYAFTTIKGFSWNIITLIPLAVVTGIVFFSIKDHLGDLLIPVILYIAVIAVMAWQAINLYVWKKEHGFLLIAIGACLFLVSDSFLAYGKFIADFPLGQFIVSSTYWSAITLIALSTISIDKKSKTTI